MRNNTRLNRIVSELEQDRPVEETAAVTGLSEEDVRAVRNSKLWQLRQKLVGQDEKSD